VTASLKSGRGACRYIYDLGQCFDILRVFSL
jgi:hypothetical protein